MPREGNPLFSAFPLSKSAYKRLQSLQISPMFVDTSLSVQICRLTVKTCVTAATIALFLWQASEAVYKFESRLTSLQVEVTLFTAVISVSECDQNA